jgi:hypothetical protein
MIKLKTSPTPTTMHETSSMARCENFDGRVRYDRRGRFLRTFDEDFVELKSRYHKIS